MGHCGFIDSVFGSIAKCFDFVQILEKKRGRDDPPSGNYHKVNYCQEVKEAENHETERL